MVFTILTIILLAAIVIDVVMIAYAFSRADRTRSSYFAALVACHFLYTLGYLLEIFSTTPEGALNGLRIEVFGMSMIGPLFLLTTLSLLKPKLLRGWMLPATFLYGLGFLLIILFNPLLGLYYTSVEMTPNGQFFTSVLGRGPLYYLQEAVMLCFALTAFITLIGRFIRGTAQLRRQMGTYFAGAVLAVGANVLVVFWKPPFGIDLVPCVLAVSLSLFSVDILRSRLMDIASTAFLSAVETMHDTVLVLDRDGGFVYGNHSAQALFPGLARIHVAEQVSLLENWPAALALDGTEKEIPFQLTPAGETEVRAFRASVSEILSQRGKHLGWSVVIRDTTDIAHMMNQLEELATTDSLTGICNRRQFLSLVGRDLELARRQGLTKGILLFDIDYFKKVNDTYGHQAGDQVLAVMAKTVSSQLRAYDLFARYGGEEFVIFTACSAGRCDGILAFAERIRTAIEEMQVEFEGKILHITVSIGVTTLEPGMNFDTGIATADKALYHAKENGRNRTEFLRIS